MLLGGDEFRRTQRGNNNAYCQDSEISWFDWSSLQRDKEIYHFARGMIAFRRAHPVLSKEQFYMDGDVRWLSPAGESTNWSDAANKSVGCLIREDESALLLLFNAADEETTFVVPPAQGSRWYVAVDTSRSLPNDLFASGQELLMDNSTPYHLEARSSAILLLNNSSRALKFTRSFDSAEV